MAKSKTSYKKGISGNPHGRPKKGYSITEIFHEMFQSEPKLRIKLARKILSKAMQGDLVACKLIWSYMDGLPVQHSVFEEKELPTPIMGGLSSGKNTI